MIINVYPNRLRNFVVVKSTNRLFIEKYGARYVFPKNSADEKLAKIEEWANSLGKNCYFTVKNK